MCSRKCGAVVSAAAIGIGVVGDVGLYVVAFVVCVQHVVLIGVAINAVWRIGQTGSAASPSINRAQVAGSALSPQESVRAEVCHCWPAAVCHSAASRSVFRSPADRRRRRCGRSICARSSPLAPGRHSRWPATTPRQPRLSSKIAAQLAGSGRPCAPARCRQGMSAKCSG